jgi:hypothetical protein
MKASQEGGQVPGAVIENLRRNAVSAHRIAESHTLFLNTLIYTIYHTTDCFPSASKLKLLLVNLYCLS